MASGDMMYTPSFLMIHLGSQVILRLLLKNFRGYSVGITDGNDLLSTPLRGYSVGISDGGFMKYTAEMTSGGTIYISGLMKIGPGVQTILMFCVSSLRGYSIGNTDGRDL
jgi:hypothetical protein